MMGTNTVDDVKDGSSNHGQDVNDQLVDDVNEYFVGSSGRRKKLPPWLDHFNLKDLKVLFKCSAAAWIMTILVFIGPSLRVIGQATFFGAIVIFISPPSGVVLIGFMAGLTIAIGVCLGWAWGVITMKAALATRPAADLQRQYQNLQQMSQEMSQNTLQASGQSNYQQIAIFNGAMLDTRVTVTYFCMLCFFIYLMARLRMAAPKLALTQVFAMIVSDIFLTSAPGIPSFVGTIPRVLIIPLGIAVGITLICNILFFPRSTSYIVLDEMQEILSPMNNFIEACSIHYQDPSKHMDLPTLKKKKSDILKAYQAMETNLGPLALDMSVGRWSAGDIRSLQQPLRRVLGSFTALLLDHIAELEMIQKVEERSDMAERLQQGNEKQLRSGDQQFLKAFELRKQHRLPEYEPLRNQGLKQFYSTSKNLVLGSQEAVISIIEAMNESNNKRWFARPSLAETESLKEAHAQTLAKLKKYRKECADEVARSVWEHHQDLAEEDSKEDVENDFQMQKRRNNVLVLVLEERLQALSEALEILLDRVVQLETQRQRTRFWFPGSLKDVVPWALAQDDNELINGAALQKTATQSAAAKSKGFRKSRKHSKKKNKDEQRPNSAESILAAMTIQPARPKNKASRIVVGTWDWFSNTDGLYAMRLVAVSIALGVIAVTSKTAGFFYREKGIWALIMSQTGMTPYTADFLYGVICRIGGTTIGGVVGLVAWYIGAGNGPGNPYGMAAIMVPVILMGMWLRLFASPAVLQGVIMAAATAYLVVSYSWTDAHIPSYGNPGVGYSVFWRRLLLVLVGTTAASIVQLFPRPPSATRFYRESLATAIETIKDHYALLGACHQRKPEDFEDVVQESALKLAKTLIEIEPRILLTKLEFSTSNIHTDALSSICQLCVRLNQYTAQLMVYSMGLPDNFKDRFFRATGALDDGVVANVMTLLTLAQHALRSGEPLPGALPTPLMERTLSSMKQKFEKENLDVSKYDEALFADPTVRKYVAASAAFVQLLGTIDELVLVLKQSLGEKGHFASEVEV